MRLAGSLVTTVALLVAVAAPAAEQPAARPVPEELQDAVAKAAAAEGKPLPIGTMSELMINLIYPTSDAVLYITTRTPTNDVEWNELTAKTLMLAESANLLMMPSRAMDQDRWMK